MPPEQRDSRSTVRLDVAEAIELGQMLTFISDPASDRTLKLGTSLTLFAGAAYSLSDLQADIARFTALLGDDTLIDVSPPERPTS